MGLMTGKRGIVMGVANNRSIAWGVARALSAQGAEIAFTYQDAFETRVRALAEEIGSVIILPWSIQRPISPATVLARAATSSRSPCSSWGMPQHRG